MYTKDKRFNIRKDSWHFTVNNGFFFLGCIAGNLIKKDYLPVLIMIPFALLMFILAWVSYKYGK